ncbi:MAG: FtsW/RodA/SpoVE family cell cycle protein [Bryobacteraceae bacterium]
MILVFFLVLLLAYVAAFLGVEHRQDIRMRASWWIVATALAVLSSGLVLYVVFSATEATEAKNATQLAWIGIATRRAEDSLELGGSRQKATVGWPNGSFAPAVSFRAAGPKRASITIGGGGGFVGISGVILNGTMFSETTRAQVAGFTVDADSVPGRFCVRCRATIRIFDAEGKKLAEIRPRVGSEPRVSSLYSNLTVDIARLRKTDPSAAGALESWSSDLRLLVSRAGLRILGPETQPVSAILELPARLTVYWTGQAQPLSVKEAPDGRLEVTFLPPWRLASPLPPESHLTLESSALPGDYAFLLPLGGDLRSFNATVGFEGASFAKPDRSAHEFQKVISQDSTFAGKYAIRLASVRDLPDWPRVLAALLIAVATFGYGMWLAISRMRWRDGWVLGGVLTATWVILSIRVLLAFRYAIDPSHFDKLAFDGVTSALRALCIVPALIIVAARLRRDRAAQFRFASDSDKAAAGQQVALYLLWVGIASMLTTWLAHSLWPNVRERYGHSAINLGTLFSALLITIALLWVAGYIFFLYFYDPEREASQRFRAKLEELRSRFLRRITETFALEHSQGFWRHLGSTLDDDEEFDRQDYRTRLEILSGVLLALVCVAVVIGGIAWLMGGSEKFVQEVAAPLLLCWMPACLWLAARLRFRPGSRMSRRDLWWLVPWLLVGVLLILAPVVLFPVLLGDAGGIVAAFAFFWPAVALLMAGGKPRRLQLIPMGTLLFTLLMFGVVYLNVDYVTRLPGEARVRLLIFKEGMNLQERLPSLPMLKEDAGRTVTVRQVSQGLQHTWENKSIAHEGGWFGLGFDKAPVRRSQVPQHTLQVDSTYSFYIASEFGLIGGMALLLIYACPLLWVLISARPRFDTGHGLAAVICSALLLEAIIHAGMNLTALPYTGRDLPLLAVGSFTDLLRWTLLLCLMVRALQWRAMAAEPSATEPGAADEQVEGFLTESIISPAALPGATESVQEPAGRYRFAVIWLALLPAILFGYTVFKGIQLIRDPGLSRPFQWTRLLNAVRTAADQGKLKVDPKTLDIQIADESMVAEGGTLIEQEVARFNALDENEKLEGSSAHGAEFRNRLRQVHSLRDYDRLLEWLRSVDSEELNQERPLLFRLAPDPRSIDEEGMVPIAGRSYQIRPNPAFNTSVSFHELRKQDIPAVSLRGQVSGMYVVRGRDFEFRVPDRVVKGFEDRTVTLEEGANGALRKIGDSNPDAAEAKITIRYRPEKRGRPSFAFGGLKVTTAGLVFRPEVDARLIRTHSLPKKLPRFAPEKLGPGNRVEVSYPVGKNKIQPWFTVEKTAQGALIGPAWVMGNWVAAYDPDPLIPWTANLANAMPDEQTRLGKDLPSRLGTLTFDKSLQAAAQAFAAEKGREHYQSFLQTARARRDALPPRVAIAVINLPRGEVLALGGWPRMSSNRHWETGTGGELIPPVTWVDRGAPHSLRIRYQSDRNFDRIAVGSASKPLWASAVLRLHRGLENKLQVRGSDELENDVFGITIPGKGWILHPSGWHDFEKYLAVSDNRYQVRIGFLGLARSDPDRPSEIAADGRSPSTKESLDGGRTAWQRYPVFEDIDFMPARPERIRGLEQSKLAERLKAMYGIGIETGEIVHRRSFWTGNEQNDWDPIGKAPLSQALEYTAPEAPDFEFNRIENPRRFITLLLGGGANLWSNVDFAGAFGTAILGVPVTPHVTRLDAKLIKPTKERAEGFDNPAAFYAGLRDVLDNSDGTANKFLRGNHVLANLSGVQHFAKTGTLGSEEGPGNVSRITLALVRGDIAKKTVQNGLVISVVVEHAALGAATQMLGEFLTQNEGAIRRQLGLR